MGSGRGGLHTGTWGSREGEELRRQVLAAVQQSGGVVAGNIAGDAAAELAEVLVRIAMGDAPEEAIPEPGEIAFDLALDFLSPFIPGGGRATRELSLAARKSAQSKAFLDALKRGIVSGENLEKNAEHAGELFKVTDLGYFGVRGRSRH